MKNKVHESPIGMPKPTQFTLLRLVLTVSLYAAVFAFVAAFQLPTLQSLVIPFIVTIFAVCDVWFLGSTPTIKPIWSRAALMISYYTTAFAVACIGCMAAFLWNLPESVSQSPKPPVNASVYDLSAAFEPIALTAVYVIVYVLCFSLFSAVAFFASLFAVRQSQVARWLLFVNLPGAICFCFFALGFLLGNETVEEARLTFRNTIGHSSLVIGHSLARGGP